MPALDHVSRTLLPSLTCLLLACAAAHAQPSPGTTTGDAGWSGTLGAGVVAFPKYVGGKSTQAVALPIAYIDYNDWFYVDLYRAGAYVWSSEDKKQGISLAVEPRIGFNAGDGPRLAGMASRRSSLFGGVTYNAENAYGSMSLGYFSDLGNNSRGSYLDLLLNRPFIKNDRWNVSGTLEVSRSDARLNNYYFGVTPTEVTAARPLYTAAAATNLTLWVTGQYNMTKQYALMFGANITRLGSGAASSPIVERRDVPFLYLGLGRNL